LAEVLITYDNLLTRIWCMVIDRLPDVSSSHIAEHVALLTAIVGGNATDAEAIAYEHVISFERLVRAAL
jgi:DNA-binding GntR family transcriptional regulator